MPKPFISVAAECQNRHGTQFRRAGWISTLYWNSLESRLSSNGRRKLISEFTSTCRLSTLIEQWVGQNNSGNRQPVPTVTISWLMVAFQEKSDCLQVRFCICLFSCWLIDVFFCHADWGVRCIFYNFTDGLARVSRRENGFLPTIGKMGSAGQAHWLLKHAAWHGIRFAIGGMCCKRHLVSLEITSPSQGSIARWKSDRALDKRQWFPTIPPTETCGKPTLNKCSTTFRVSTPAAPGVFTLSVHGVMHACTHMLHISFVRSNFCVVISDCMCD